ncbi:MAG: serine/threonine protein kinase [Planctomycetes bacterium]|nr:serine/threonine protein kinase [Planctomycetota bacterium]
MREIGSGGFGVVFLAHARHLGIRVAVKRFKRTAGDTQKALSDWARESALHQRISHPNILKVHDAFLDRGELYLVTELASGSLDDLCVAGAPLAFPRNRDSVIRAGIHLSSALHFLHEGMSSSTRVVHRDVTPKNVFYFRRTSLFKLGDFGISKRLNHPDDVALTHVANWRFVSFDLIRDGFTVPQSDLFQLGLVLHSIVARRPIVPIGASISQARRAIARGDAHKAIAATTDIDPTVRSVLKRLVIRDRDRRFLSARDVHQAFVALAR